MSRGTDISDEDRELFREAMSEVAPLNTDRRAPDGPKPVARAAQREADEAEAREALVTGALDDPEADLAEELTHARPGIQHRVWHRLRRGKYTIDAELDLHGMTRVEAATALEQFMR
ncbi:MAG: DNA mismatch repair protein MutS, partial [Halofilum sp. (in: g-proteobacteria)]